MTAVRWYLGGQIFASAVVALSSLWQQNGTAAALSGVSSVIAGLMLVLAWEAE